MNVPRFLLSFPYTYALFFLFSALFPSLRLFFLAPWPVYVACRHTNGAALLAAFSSGFLLDILTTGTPTGFFTLIYPLALSLILSFKKLFFQEKLLTYPFLTTVFSFLITALYFIFRNIFCAKMTLTLHSFLTDWIVFPFADGLYAFISFTLPLRFLFPELSSERKKRSSYVLKKTRNGE